MGNQEVQALVDPADTPAGHRDCVVGSGNFEGPVRTLGLSRAPGFFRPTSARQVRQVGPPGLRVLGCAIAAATSRRRKEAPHRCKDRLQ